MNYVFYSIWFFRDVVTPFNCSQITLKEARVSEKYIGWRNTKQFLGLSLFLNYMLRNLIFQLIYELNVMISIELREKYWWRQVLDENNNNDNLRVEFDSIHKIREESKIRKDITKK